MSYLLYIDTSGQTATVALSQHTAVAALRIHEDAREQAALLNGMIDEVLLEAAATWEQVTAICVCAGPGSYTGLRVGLSTAKGLAYALDKPIMLFSNLDLLAATYGDNRPVDIVLKAREGEYFFAQYDNEREQVAAPQHIFLKDLEQCRREEALLVTDDPALPAEGAIQVIEAGKPVSMPHWIAVAGQRLATGRLDDLAYAEPFYLKAAYTTQSKK
jgi:tRNA threonylcarbamoyladenosine biosynthesis protein TsaB